MILYLLSPKVGLTPPGTSNQNVHGSDACKEHRFCTRKLDKCTREDLTEICGQYNVTVTARDNTGQNTDKGHTPSPKMGIKISNPTSRRGGPVIIILATGSEVRGFKPGRGRWIFQSVKILSMSYFAREVKLSVPCHRFTACKRTSGRN